MPTKRLLTRPSLDHLKAQAKDLLKQHARRDPETLQRLRELHPRFSNLDDTAIAGSNLTLSDAQLAVAREYGYAPGHLSNEWWMTRLAPPESRRTNFITSESAILCFAVRLSSSTLAITPGWTLCYNSTQA